MSDKKDFKELLKDSKIVGVEVNDEMKKSFISYAMAVNISRAIPDVRDGLKPVHRRILYAMNEINTTYDKPHRKCARIVGEVLGKYHPHGDTSVYDALVRLAQDFSMREPLINGQGNFGSVDGDSPAAMRYTEARMSKIASELLRDIEKNTVDYYPNFDDTLMQPTVLPARFPNLLVNGSEGIAVGMATSIPPHNLEEVIDATIATIDNPEITIDEIIEIMPAPDFPTGAEIMGWSGIKRAYRTGRGKAIVRAKADIETVGSKNRIIVTELPYQVNKAKLIESIADLVKKGRIEGISNVNEESDKSGLRITIDVKRGTDPNYVLNLLYKYTNMQTTQSMIMLALVDQRPKTLNIKEILEEYIKSQVSVIERRTRFDLEKALDREHILQGLSIALANIDEVIKIIKESKDNQEAKKGLTDNFELSERQAEAILEMKLRRLTSLEVEKIENELEELKKAIAEYKAILSDPEKVNAIIKEELLEIRSKYGNPRRTELVKHYIGLDEEDLIEEEDVVVSVTRDGYIKRIELDEYKVQRRGGVGVIAQKTKESDDLADIFVTNTHDDLLFFTNKGKVYKIKAYMIPEATRMARGRAVVNLINFEEGEEYRVIMPFNKEHHDGYVCIATKNGLIKKTKAKEYIKVYRSGKRAITLADDDMVVSAMRTTGDDEILVASSGGKCIRFSEEDIRPTGRTSMGVIAIKLGKKEHVVDAAVITEGKDVLTVMEKGMGKISPIEQYTLQKRAGKGVKIGTLNKKTGNVVAVKLVTQEDEIMVINSTGTVIRIKLEEIRPTGRTSQGVKIKRTKGEDDVVASVAVIPNESLIEAEVEEKKLKQQNKVQEEDDVDDSDLI